MPMVGRLERRCRAGQIDLEEVLRHGRLPARERGRVICRGKEFHDAWIFNRLGARPSDDSQRKQDSKRTSRTPQPRLATTIDGAR